MDRLFLRFGYLLAVVLLLGAIVPLGGCRSALATAMYLMGGMNVKAEYDGLKDQRVVVVCRPLVELQYRDSSAAKDIARQVSTLIRQNLSKTKVVDHRNVVEWIDENTWEDYTEIGRALNADLVLGVDLEHFGIFQGQTLYQGKANVVIKIYDCDTDELVFEKILPQTVYPPNTGIPTSEKQEPQFRREFIRVLADQIARHFYDHDPHSDFAQDVLAAR